MKQENMTHIEREILIKIHPWMTDYRVSRQTHWNIYYNSIPHVNKLEESLNL